MNITQDAPDDEKESGELILPDRDISEDTTRVPVTAIGASAGGLEPIERFFDLMPADSGSAFVIVQHLSPDFRSLMDELLSRHSKMKISHIKDGATLQPNCIYLNPPRTSLKIEHNKLTVEDINPDDSIYLPIDLFFHSLATDRGAEAIALVLSGTGSDGTKGAASISDAGGKVLVQDPTTTRFDSMPRSVIADVDCALIAPPQMLAQGVQRILKGQSVDELDNSARKPLPDPYLDILSMLLFSHGTDFLQYKDATIKRRIERRAHMLDVGELTEYRNLLKVDSTELQELYADLLIEVTEFFRDQQAFEILQTKVIPNLTANLKSGSGLRIWVPGCASGEEAYSIAILLQEQARHMGIFLHLKILATDIHVRSMSQASSGIYEQTALANMPSDIIHRYFDCADGQAQIKPAIRNMVFFSTHDVTRDPPFTRIDLISCRNLLIYLKEEAQEKVINLLHFSLRKDGFLFLGPSEHIGAIANEFETINEKWRVYRKRRDVKLLATESIFRRTDLENSAVRANSGNRLMGRHSGAAPEESVPFKRAQRAALEFIVEKYAPAGFLLSKDGSIVHIFGNAVDLVPIKTGNFSKRVIDLVRPALKVIVTSAIDHSRQKHFEGFNRIAYVKESESTTIAYEVDMIPIELPGEATTFNLLSIEKKQTVSDINNDESLSVSAAELAAINSSETLQQRIQVLENSLQSSEENLQSTIEELETSNEELQSTNEELMSSNEELQSTNEELHSVNEELYTVSAEHQRKNEELIEREADLHVLLEASKIGTVHIEDDLTLRRYTNNARTVFNILPQDIGRPIDHITVQSQEHDIIGLIRQANLEKTTHEVQVSVDKQMYLLRVMPYHQDDRAPSGVLVTVIDITDLEQVRSQLADLDTQYRDSLENTDSFFVHWNAKTEEILYCNKLYAETFQKDKDEIIGTRISHLRQATERQPFREAMASYKPNEARSEIYNYTDPTGKVRSAHVLNRAISHDNKTIDEFHTHGVDCTQEVNYNHALQQLFPVFADETLDLNGKLENLLAIGLEYFRLQGAVITAITRDSYEYTCAIGSLAKIEKKTTEALDLSPYAKFENGAETMAINNVSQSNKLPYLQAAGTESFIGASVHTASHRYGTVSFISNSTRKLPFEAQDENFCLLIANWIGFLIGNKEQINLMADQTEYYKDLYFSIPAMMFLCDKGGTIISASDRLCEQLGIQAELVTGKNCLDLFTTKYTKVLQTALDDGEARNIPLALTTLDGSAIDVELNSRVKSVGAFHDVRMVVLSDVSERNRAFKKTEDQNRRLEAANENLNQFAFIASHDLQEPLRKIQQFSSFLQDDLGDKLDTDAKYHLSVVVDASERMSTLIYDLLRYSGASQEEPNIEKIPLNGLFDIVLSDLELSIDEAGATFNIEDLPEVMGDRALLRQLFANLIGNSIKYRSTERDLIVNISVIGSTKQDGLLLSDNGIGFDPEFSNKIFDPFTRLHNNNQYKGNGIGLAICSTVCEKHKWSLTANGEVDRGCDFTISFTPESSPSPKQIAL